MPGSVPKPDAKSLSNHPLNLAVAFGLELAMLAALAYWGWTQHEGVMQPLLCVGVPLGAAALWGVFRVPGAPNAAPVAIPGWLRLLLEWGLYALAVFALVAANQPTIAAVFAVVVVVHYVVSIDQVRWKLDQ